MTPGVASLVSQFGDGMALEKKIRFCPVESRERNVCHGDNDVTVIDHGIQYTVRNCTQYRSLACATGCGTTKIYTPNRYCRFEHAGCAIRALNCSSIVHGRKGDGPLIVHGHKALSYGPLMLTPQRLKLCPRCSNEDGYNEDGNASNARDIPPHDPCCHHRAVEKNSSSEMMVSSGPIVGISPR